MATDTEVYDPCASCLLDCDPLEPSTPSSARFLVVTKPPTAQQLRKGEYLSPTSSKLFAKYMRANGFKKSDFAFCPSVRCEFQQDRMIAKDRNVVKKACRNHLLDTIEELNPEVILPLGADAAAQVLGRAVKITKVRGVPSDNEDLGAMVLPLLDPSFVHMYPQHEALFASDCNSFARVVKYDYDLSEAEQEVLGDYQVVTDLQFLIDAKPEILCFDVETLGMRWQDEACKLLTMQFCVEPGKAYLVPWDHPESTISQRTRRKLRRQLRELLCAPDTSVIGHNVKYDALWVWREFGFKFRMDGDTLMLAAIVDENLQNKDLNTLVKMYVPEMAGYDDAFNAKWDKSRMDLVPLPEIVGYGCGDTDACLRLHDILEEKVWADEKLWMHYRRVSIPGINAFRSVETRGMLIAEQALDNFEEVLSASVEELRSKLMRQVPRSIKRKHAAKGLSFSRREFLVDILFAHQDGFRFRPKVYTKSTQNLEPHLQVPSTSTKDHLPYFFDKDDFVIDLAQYIKDERLLSTNVRRFRENYLHNGKIYPRYSLWTAVTGRSASKDPNGQNFPKRGDNAKAYRSIFVPPEGCVLLEADLSQAELRIAGEMSGDPVITQIYQEDGDIHTATALIVMGVSEKQFRELPKEDQKLARFKAKAVNFGFIYGMGWRKFIIYAKTQYGVEFTEQESKRIRNGYFSKYRALLPWHETMRSFARQHGYVRSFSGRVRHLPMIYSDDEGVAAEAGRQAINSPVQEFGSSLGVMSMGRIEAEVDPQYLALAGFVHDALYAWVPYEYVEWGAKTMKWYMESNPIEEWFGVDLRIPIKADVGFGIDGGHTHEMEQLKLDEPYRFDVLHGPDSDDPLEFELPQQFIPPNDGRVETPDHMIIHV